MAEQQTPFSRISTSSDNAVVIKAATAEVGGWYLTNNNAAPVYLKLYDKATAPSNSDTPALRLEIPGNTAGAGANIALTDGIAFNTGLSMRLVAGMADNNNTAVTASDQLINIWYR